MNKTTSDFTKSVLVVFFMVLMPTCLLAAHPFLIVTEANYPELQSRASTQPWTDMKGEAISDAGSITFNTGSDYVTQSGQMDDIASTCALAYILDPTNRSTYVTKFYNTAMTAWPSYLRPGLLDNDFQRCVIPGIAYFNSVLALDIMHDDFTAGQLSDLETEFQLVANWYESHSPSWQLNLYACRGIWALYADDRTKIDDAKDDYRNELFVEQTSADGVALMGPGYAGVRLSQERESKGNFLDVLTFTGEDDYYNDSTAINLMEWLYGYGVTPFRQYYTFGDSAPNRNYHQKGASVFRAHRFSDKAGRYAAWNNNNIAPWGRLLHYVLMDQQLLTPERAPSRIFPDGGAWFVESGADTRALSVVLFNPMDSESHSHKDVSAIHMAAYGEHVIRNSGYAGWGLPSGYWTYVHDQAYSNSTVFINNSDHAQKYGSGIVEGFTAPELGLGYACSDSGPAISNGSHYRSLLFIHPNDIDGTNGYSVLFDEFDADTSSNLAGTRLHPNADNMTTITSNTEYQSQINQVTFSGHTVYISIFLGTAPTAVAVNTGVLAHMADQDFNGKYLFSEYDTDGSGVVNVATVLFPHDSTHAKATMTRISGTGYTGASIVQGGITDIALESAGTGIITYSGVSFQGLATWYRDDSGLVSSYFVREGSSFDDGVSPQVGFGSVSDVSIYMNEIKGRIVSPGTNVTFYYPGIGGVLLNDSPLSVISSGSDWVQVNIPAGTHEVELEFWYASPDIDGDYDVDFEDFAILASQWEQEPGTPSADLAPVGGDGIVDGQDLAEFLTEWLYGAGPPTPNPLVWETVPYVTGSRSIEMVATTADDPAGEEYYFTCTAGGGNDSSWQDSTTYEDTGLTPETQYTYTVKARDKSPGQNETDPSSSASATTLAIQLPGQASNPSPSDANTGIGIAADLSWTAGSYATSHDVYFGTVSPGTFRGNQGGTIFNPGIMNGDTTYYWRIDERNDDGTTTGIVWSFTTEDATVSPPVSLYEFEGDFSNSISGPAATAVGNAQIVTDGEKGQVLSLDGSGDYLNCGNDSIESGGSIILDTAMTLAAWIKSSDMDGDDGVISYGWAWRMLGNGGKIRFKNTTLSVGDFSGTVNVADGDWHHVAVVYDSVAATLTIYVDGDVDNSTGCTGLLNTWNGYQFAVGYVLSGTHGYFNGLMDDASVYDYALSEAEIEILAGQ